MRFIVESVIPSLFVDKTGSELSFIPRHNLYPCASYLPGVHSQKYSHPCPLLSIPRASYPFLFDQETCLEEEMKISHQRWLKILGYYIFPKADNSHLNFPWDD
ncbi:hypothetical protein ES288_A10G121200v1 [Gossypium darwinii]|uniref:Uncharacterized protein n=1 Tax=Gossypium darwinii TaxID=34276 RepID=A0A5D2EXX0_GOSDA|nr:hypothetical protein ES288_A10G121200v1 [Gossypium darwinii]